MAAGFKTPLDKRKEQHQQNIGAGPLDIKSPIKSSGQNSPKTVGPFNTKVPGLPQPKKEVLIDPKDVKMERLPKELTDSEKVAMNNPALKTNLKFSEEKFSPQKGGTYQARTYENPGAGQATTALNRRFDVLRQKAEGNASLQQDQANASLARGAAARGRLGSGNVVKQQMLVQKELAGQREASINDIESQRGIGLEEQNQRESDRRFAFNQEEAGRAFQSGEAAGQRNFASKEAVSQRNYEGKNTVADQNFRNSVFNQQNDQFRQQMDQAIAQMKLDEKISRFNMNNASKRPNSILDPTGHLQKGGILPDQLYGQ